MAAEKSPAFQFYPKDFLSDPNVISMRMAERGAYITLLCLCWMEQVLPADPDELARLCKIPRSIFAAMWPNLSRCFILQNGTLVQPRLEREREKQHIYKQLQSLKGKLSAAGRFNRGSGSVQPEGNSSSSSSTTYKNKLVQTPVQVLPSTACGRQKTDVDDEPLTRQETTLAERILKSRFGRCEHDPPCHNSLACTNKIAYEIRAKRNGG